jgi:hypothetical protein
MRALQEKLRAGGPPRVRTPRDLLATAGRVALWLVVALLLVHGASDMLRPADDAPERRAARAELVPEWPNDAARALAVEFATAYLTHTRARTRTRLRSA